jgi:hypothetical protein
MKTHNNWDSYRKAMRTYQVLLGLQLLLFKLLLVWVQLALLVKLG